MKLSDLLYHPSALERALTGVSEPAGIPEPGRGYHSLWEWSGQVEDDLSAVGGEVGVVVAYLVGGGNDGDRVTVVLQGNLADGLRAAGLRYGGFYLPVPICSVLNTEHIMRQVRRLQPQQLLRLEQVPGFDADGRHRDGWFTRSVLARPLGTGDYTLWGEGARFFDLREGVYIVFPDESFRLVSRREFWGIRAAAGGEPFARQGDLLVFSIYPPANEEFAEGEPFPGPVPGDGSRPVEIDRHRLVSAAAWASARPLQSAWGTEWMPQRAAVLARGPLRIEHPEHEAREVGGEGWYLLAVAPGTSRPFARQANGFD